MTTEPTWRRIDWSAHTRVAQLPTGRVQYIDIGTGPPVVLLHGLGMTARMWLPNIAALAADGYRVIAPDLPGFGGSERLPWRRSLRAHAVAITDLIDHLNAVRAVVVGHSLGGLVAQNVSRTLGPALGGLVLVSSPDSGARLTRRVGVVLALSGIRLLMYHRPLERWLISRPRLRRPLFGGLVADPDAIPQSLIVEMAGGYAANGFWRAVYAAFGDPVSHHLTNVRSPALVLNGAADKLITPASARRLAASLPRVRLDLWPGIGHAPMIERPNEFDSVIGRFVDEVLDTGEHRAAN